MEADPIACGIGCVFGLDERWSPGCDTQHPPACGHDAAILQRLGGAPDHPTDLTFPEGEYLKGLVVMRKP